MIGWIAGIVLVAAGVSLLAGALPFVHHAGRLWPVRHTRGSADLLASSAFLIRFIGLLVLVAGLGVILFEILSE